MLIRLIREHLRPYKKPILIVVGLQFIGTATPATSCGTAA
jgi:hypothetical protein